MQEERTAYWDCTLFHLLPSGMHDEGHGKPFPQPFAEGNIHGSGPGFHSDSDDDFLRDVLHGNRSEGSQTGLRGKGHDPQEEAEILLFSKIMIQVFCVSENSLNIAPRN